MCTLGTDIHYSIFTGDPVAETIFDVNGASFMLPTDFNVSKPITTKGDPVSTSATTFLPLRTMFVLTFADN